MTSWGILCGDVREQLATLDDGSVRTCVTSPPYWALRDYGVPGQIGLEATPEDYVATMVDVFAHVHRVLADDGTLWLNLGDTYAMRAQGASQTSGSHDGALGRADRPSPRSRLSPGLKNKDLVGIPWMVAFALRGAGWYLRSDIVWHKPSPMPESVTDRPTSAHEHVFLLSKSPRYFYDADAIRQPLAAATIEAASREKSWPGGAGRPDVRGEAGHPLPSNALGANARNVWTIATRPFKGAHFACMPPDLAERCVLAGSAEGDTVLDPFAGAGTTAVVALRHGRSFVGTEINPEYVELARHRIADDSPLFNTTAEVAA